METKSKSSVKNSAKSRTRGLRPFPKGVSGNPKGHPKGQRNYATIYREALIKIGSMNGKTPEELETELISSGFLKARKGDYRFYKDVLDRIHGMPVQKNENENKGQITIVLPAELVNKNGSTQRTK
jgi:hypothetical protein